MIDSACIPIEEEASSLPILTRQRAKRLALHMQSYSGTAAIVVRSTYDTVLIPLLKALAKRVYNAGGFITWSPLDRLNPDHAIENVDDMILSCLDREDETDERPMIVCTHLECVSLTYLPVLAESLTYALDRDVRVVVTLNAGHERYLHDLPIGMRVSPDEFAQMPQTELEVFQDGVLHPFMTVREAAWVLHVSESTIYAMIEAGSIDDCVIRVGRSIRLSTSKLLTYASLDRSDVTAAIEHTFSGTF